MRIDSHQHFWIYSPEEYPWMTEPLREIRRDFLPADLEREMKPCGMESSIAVQARQSLEESRWLLRLAGDNSAICGVVGWVDLLSESVTEQLAELAPHPKFVGVRHVVQDEPDDEFMLRPDFQRGIGALREFKLVYDLLVFPKQLPAAISLASKFPEQPFVLDHIAKPFIKTGALSPWKEQIQELARHPQVACKVSGLVTEANWKQWRLKDFRPYFDVVFEAFGEDRLMFGSDWPVCRLSGSYEQVHQLAAEHVAHLPAAFQEKFWGLNAARIYKTGGKS